MNPRGWGQETKAAVNRGGDNSHSSQVPPDQQYSIIISQKESPLEEQHFYNVLKCIEKINAEVMLLLSLTVSSHPELLLKDRTLKMSWEHNIQSQESRIRASHTAACELQSEEAVVLFELMIFPLASKETKVTGLCISPREMKGIKEVGMKGTQFPSHGLNAVFLTGDPAACSNVPWPEISMVVMHIEGITALLHLPGYRSAESQILCNLPVPWPHSWFYHSPSFIGNFCPTPYKASLLTSLRITGELSAKQGLPQGAAEQILHN